MDGTRTFLVGDEKVAVIDPGPEVETHFRALSSEVESARHVKVLLTHGHSDHAGLAPRFAAATQATLLTPALLKFPNEALASTKALLEGDHVSTDWGDLVVVELPGHSRDHVGFHWPESNALFVGDLLLGRGNTTWVGEYLGCVSDYLASLEKVRLIGARVLYPSHGPPIEKPTEALDLFRRHRLERLEEVRRARLDHPGAEAEELARVIYGGEIPDRLKKAAAASVAASLFHLG